MTSPGELLAEGGVAGLPYAPWGTAPSLCSPAAPPSTRRVWVTIFSNDNPRRGYTFSITQKYPFACRLSVEHTHTRFGSDDTGLRITDYYTAVTVRVSVVSSPLPRHPEGETTTKQSLGRAGETDSSSYALASITTNPGLRSLQPLARTPDIVCPGCPWHNPSQDETHR